MYTITDRKSFICQKYIIVAYFSVIDMNENKKIKTDIRSIVKRTEIKYACIGKK